jgi:hypothetical protein
VNGFLPRLARLSRRAGRRVAGRHGVVDVDQDARVCCLVSAGEGDPVLGVPGATAAADSKLGAREVELGATDAARAV